MSTSRLIILSTVVFACATLAQTTHASLLFSRTQGTHQAQVTFEIEHDNLIITLANISGFDVQQPSELLTGVFFDLTTPLSDDEDDNRDDDHEELHLESANVLSPHSVLFGAAGSQGNVGDQWGFVSALVGAPGGASYGISSAGLGLFGPNDLIENHNHLHPQNPAPGGMGFGITSRGDDPTLGNRAVTGMNPLIQHSVTFVLDDLPKGFREEDIKNVWVQYGTSLSEPSFSVVVPTPGSLALFGLGAMLFAGRQSRTGHT